MKIICVALFLIGGLCPALMAQADSTRFEYGLPVTDDDTAKNFPSADIYPLKSYQRLNATQLPKKVLKALRRKEYKGWQQGDLYFDRNTEIYIVEVPRDKDVYVFGLSEEGKPVSLDIYTRKDLR
jgi:hypothetical protein